MNKNRRKQRYRTNLIIRLIDVVLILLFGFIAISEVSKRSKICLAESTTVPATVPDRERVLYVGVLPDNRFLVEEETAVIENPAALAAYLAQQRERMEARNIRMKVRVRANHDAPVRLAFAVVNICQEMKIPVGLDVIKKNRG